jgi:hypothetical protein
VAKHIQLPAVGAGIRLGIIITFVILIKVHYKQERTHINIGDGIAVLVMDGCLGTRYYW